MTAKTTGSKKVARKSTKTTTGSAKKGQTPKAKKTSAKLNLSKLGNTKVKQLKGSTAAKKVTKKTAVTKTAKASGIAKLKTAKKPVKTNGTANKVKSPAKSKLAVGVKTKVTSAPKKQGTTPSTGFTFKPFTSQNKNVNGLFWSAKDTFAGKTSETKGKPSTKTTVASKPGKVVSIKSAKPAKPAKKATKAKPASTRATSNKKKGARAA